MSAASYLSSFLNTTTSKYNNLKQNLISSDADGDTEDDSHISRVLRAYYTEKGRPFPEWLPPDPKAPPPPQPASMVMASQGQPQMATGGRWGRGGGISDLWDAPKGGQQQMQQQPESLRPPRFGQQAGGEPGGAARPGRFGDLYGNAGAARPQAGGRIGSYESAGRMSAPSPAPSTGSGGTAKDMLKAKFSWGNRTTSPTPSTGSGAGGFAPPARDASPALGGRGESSPYGGANDSGGRFATPSYGDERSGSYGSGSGGRLGDSGSSGGAQGSAAGPRGYGSNPYGAAGGGIKRGTQGGRMGLPSGPRPQRS